MVRSWGQGLRLEIRRRLICNLSVCNHRRDRRRLLLECHTPLFASNHVLVPGAKIFIKCNSVERGRKSKQATTNRVCLYTKTNMKKMRCERPTINGAAQLGSDGWRLLVPGHLEEGAGCAKLILEDASDEAGGDNEVLLTKLLLEVGMCNRLL